MSATNAGGECGGATNVQSTNAFDEGNRRCKGPLDEGLTTKFKQRSSNNVVQTT